MSICWRRRSSRRSRSSRSGHLRQRRCCPRRPPFARGRGDRASRRSRRPDVDDAGEADPAVVERRRRRPLRRSAVPGPRRRPRASARRFRCPAIRRPVHVGSRSSGPPVPVFSIRPGSRSRSTPVSRTSACPAAPLASIIPLCSFSQPQAVAAVAPARCRSSPEPEIVAFLFSSVFPPPVVAPTICALPDSSTHAVVEAHPRREDLQGAPRPGRTDVEYPDAVDLRRIRRWGCPLAEVQRRAGADVDRSEKVGIRIPGRGSENGEDAAGEIERRVRVDLEKIHSLVGRTRDRVGHAERGQIRVGRCAGNGAAAPVASRPERTASLVFPGRKDAHDVASDTRRTGNSSAVVFTVNNGCCAGKSQSNSGLSTCGLTTRFPGAQRPRIRGLATLSRSAAAGAWQIWPTDATSFRSPTSQPAFRRPICRKIDVTVVVTAASPPNLPDLR